MTTPSAGGRRPVVAADITEVTLPGIGQRYDMVASEGGEVTVVIHHSGRRDLYLVDDDDKPRAAVSLSDTQARNLGAILGGAYFKPAIVEEIEAAIGGLLIDWLTLGPEAPSIGHTIAELQVRSRTRMTIAAILRDHVPIIAPDPDEALQAGDRLIVVGRQEDLPGFRRTIAGR